MASMVIDDDAAPLPREVSVGVQQIVPKIQRDLNCLADPDRQTRRKGLLRLKEVVLERKSGKPNSAYPREVLASLFTQHLQGPLLKLFADSSENCRESSVQLVHTFVALVLDEAAAGQERCFAQLAAAAFPAMAKRIGVSQTDAEPTEEIRLLQIRLVTALLMKPSVAPALEKDSVCHAVNQSIAKSLLDSFPDIKRECAASIRALVKVAPNVARAEGDVLLRNLVTNLGHQHSKTRQLTLQGLGQLIVCYADPPAAGATSAGTAGAPAGVAEPIDPADHTSKFNKLMEDVVLPGLQKCVVDHSAQVRHTVARMLSFLLRARPEKTSALEKFEPTLLTMLVTLSTDLTDEVTGVAEDCLAAVATHCLAHGGGAAAAAAAAADGEGEGGLTRYVGSMVPRMIPPLLSTTSHWTVNERCKALDTLAAVIKICDGGVWDAAVAMAGGSKMEVEGEENEEGGDRGGAMGPFLPSVMDSLCRVLQDDDAEVITAASHCAAALGASSQGPSLLELVVPRIRGEGAGMDTPQNRTAGLLLLTAALGGEVGQGGGATSAMKRAAAAGHVVGASETVLAPAALRLSEALAEPGLMMIEDLALTEALLDACTAMVRRAPAACSSLREFGASGEEEFGAAAHTCSRLVRALVQIQGNADVAPFNDSELALAEDALAAVEAIAKAAGVSDVSVVYADHLDPILDMLVALGEGEGDDTMWASSTPPLRAFDALVRRVSSGDVAGLAGPHLSRLVPIIVRHSKQGRSGAMEAMAADPELQLNMLAILETLLSAAGNEQYWPQHTPVLLQEVLVGNMVWKAGRVASTVRKVAVACFYSLLHNGYADKPVLFAIAPHVLPILKTDLDDYDASTRQLVCISLKLMFEALPGAMSDQPVQELYPSLLKRLDDSSDEVRFAVCQTFKAFFLAAPPSAFRGTVIDYTLDQLLVHLDDQDPAIQALLFEVIQNCIPIDAPRVAKKASAVRSAHRSPKYIDELVRMANEYSGTAP